MMMNKMSEMVYLMTFNTDDGGTYTEVFLAIPSKERVLAVLKYYMDEAIKDKDQKAYEDRSKFYYLVSQKGLPEFVDGEWSYVDDGENEDFYVAVSDTELF